MQNLNRQIVGKPKTLPIKVMQFGGGNFLRAFVDWMIQILNEETNFNGGVMVVKPTERGDYRALKAQDGLFTVVLDGIKYGEFVAEDMLVDCIQQTVNPYTEWDAYLDSAKNPDLRFIVSNTTEAGIRFNNEDRALDAPPQEFPAKLTVWLYKRFRHFGDDLSKGCIFLPCELIEANGTALKVVILQYAELWNLDKKFINWLYTANHFCNTLVDRIVSGYPSDRAVEITNRLGYDDALMVAGEHYHSWVIQGPELVEKELPFSKTNLNIEFVNDLDPYREMKVRILNGAHTAMVPVGYLAGNRLVKEVMLNQKLSEFIGNLLTSEVSKTLDFSDAVLTKFIADVLDRFRNPILKHQLISIALNSTSKFKTRLLPTFKDYFVSQQQLPKHIVFALSALICLYKGEVNNEKIALKDDDETLQFFALNWKKYLSNAIEVNILVGIILSNASIWGEDLTKFEGLVELVAHNIKQIEATGIVANLESIN